MNKSELVEALEARLGGRKQATTAVEAIVETITVAVAKGEKVAISGFGTFEKQARNARTGRNPRTGEAVKIKKTSVPRFRPGTAFKEVVSDTKALRAYSASLKEKNGAAAAPAKKAAPAAAGAAAEAPARTTTARKAASPTATARATTGRASTATRPAAGAAATTTAKKAAPARTTAAKSAAAPAKTAARRTAKKA
ncbi:HU family DNA-binding protein [Kineococcus indalonis]|uniref:HU family DNA-binding protein n=1 Tax=Kineococcus indalonis TaxID=2696566 RepID=UPI0014121271|nr:HU family DNA-binding protein [Kineococcus indalonis]NAZ85587.1 HU family DNA-binding protein [Kineococcus indalonis]